VITITSKIMMLNHVPGKSYLEFGFTKFIDNWQVLYKSPKCTISVSECSKSTERATAVHSL